jgi:hypothetical protein
MNWYLQILNPENLARKRPKLAAFFIALKDATRDSPKYPPGLRNERYSPVFQVFSFQNYQSGVGKLTRTQETHQGVPACGLLFSSRIAFKNI